MRSISNTISRLSDLRGRTSAPGRRASSSRLMKLEQFGANPGALDAYYYLPENLAPGAPLVVVLHGCTQNASGYYHGSGWSELADEQGFAVLLPEQRRTNNMNLCFNWYEPGDSRRGAGEPLSIVEMVDAMIAQHGVDPGRVFVTGLSAGGAMTSVMLATYPDRFAGGAIIAGLPFDVAHNIPEAFDRMRGHGLPDAAALAASVRKASAHKGQWPSVAVWHGSGDHIVDASNGEAIVEQWRQVHGVAAEPSETGTVQGYPHRIWRDAKGRTLIEDYVITGMGHGTPLDTIGEDGCGTSGAYMLEVAISSTRHIAASWGLGNGRTMASKPRAADRAASRPAPVPAHQPAMAAGVTKVIEDALRAAGLMR